MLASFRALTQLSPRAWLALILSLLLVQLPTASWALQARTSPPKPTLPPEVFKPLQEALLQSYLELFEQAERLEFSPNQIQQMRRYLEQARDFCQRRWRNRAQELDKKLQQTQADLRSRTARLTPDERKRLHCEIQNLRLLKSQAETLAEHAVPVAFENRLAKLELIEKWPQEKKTIQEQLASGAHLNRRYGDVLDIGFRDVGRGQEEDVKLGKEAVEEMKLTGLMPPEVKNEAIQRYVANLTREIARHSDVRVPVQVTVLNSKEINAFALPGGFVFVQRGLLEAAENEAQLAGVIAHELAHVAARHGHRLMRRSTIASLIYQAAQVAAMILTGGVASLGTYYALQYGFYGLGLVLSLDLLGVSREFELEADQLGIQYAWHAGYDPKGFIQFFDKMATQEGYVQGISWFRTHPPFYRRMVESMKEIMFLPPKDNLVTQSEAFQQMKKELEKVVAEAKQEEEGRPSLITPEQGCPAPEKLEFKPGERRIETICDLPTE